jgi:hypothetical protein
VVVLQHFVNWFTINHGVIGSNDNAFGALPLSGSVAVGGSFAEEHVKANSAYRALF